MKYIVVLGDGMADEPIEALGGKTPLEYAATERMDALSRKGEVGMVHTIPDGMKPGSDTANLSVLGYDPKKYYSGRSPLEALSIGVPMKETDIAIRCNIVTISDEEERFEEKTIIDHSADEIGTEDCAVLLKAVQEKLQDETYQFYVGTSYRHCLIWDKGQVVELTPPHDVLGCFAAADDGGELSDPERSPPECGEKETGTASGELLLVLGRGDKTDALRFHGDHRQKGTDDLRCGSAERDRCGSRYGSRPCGRGKRRSAYEL